MLQTVKEIIIKVCALFCLKLLNKSFLFHFTLCKFTEKKCLFHFNSSCDKRVLVFHRYSYRWRSNYQGVRVGISLTGFTPPHFWTHLKPGPEIPSAYVMVLFFVPCFEARGSRSHCWYWWNYLTIVVWAIQLKSMFDFLCVINQRLTVSCIGSSLQLTNQYQAFQILQFYNQAHESYCCIYQYIFNFYHWTVMYCQIKRTDGHGETSIPPYNLVAGGIKNPTNTILIGLLFMYWKHLITNISLFFIQTVVVLVWWSLNNRVFFCDDWSFNAKSAIFQLYPGENKLIFNEMMIVSFVLDLHA